MPPKEPGNEGRSLPNHHFEDKARRRAEEQGQRRIGGSGGSSYSEPPSASKEGPSAKSKFWGAIKGFGIGVANLATLGVPAAIYRSCKENEGWKNRIKGIPAKWPGVVQDSVGLHWNAKDESKYGILGAVRAPWHAANAVLHSGKNDGRGDKSGKMSTATKVGLAILVGVICLAIGGPLGIIVGAGALGYAGYKALQSRGKGNSSGTGSGPGTPPPGTGPDDERRRRGQEQGENGPAQPIVAAGQYPPQGHEYDRVSMQSEGLSSGSLSPSAVSSRDDEHDQSVV